jgi:pimeloyl-ACP methyl ester carboxylesterase
MSWIVSSRADLQVPFGSGTHRTAVWTYPAQADPGGRPLLLIHGFRGDHHGMDLIGHHSRTHPVIVPDLPGFGATAPLPGGLSLASYVAFLAGLLGMLRERWGRQPLLVGHSFGSILAAHLAAGGVSGTLDALVLINPITSPALDGPSRLMTGLARLYYAVSARLPERAGQAVLAHPLIVRAMSEVMATTHDPGLRRYIHDQHDRHFSSFSDRDSLAQAFDVSVGHTVTEVAEQLTMPVLVIAGDADAIAPQAATERFIERLPDARAEWFADVGHLVHYERPEETARLIAQFVRQLGPQEREQQAPERPGPERQEREQPLVESPASAAPR